MNQKEVLIKEIILALILLGVVVATTLFVIRGIRLREDLSFLQIDFTDTIIEAKKCLAGGGELQDIYEAVKENKKPEDIFICNRQDVTRAVFPSLKKLSQRGIDYKYLSSKKCLSKKCDQKKTRINIGRGFSLVLSCDIEEGFCKMRN